MSSTYRIEYRDDAIADEDGGEHSGYVLLCDGTHLDAYNGREAAEAALLRCLVIDGTLTYKSAPCTLGGTR